MVAVARIGGSGGASGEGDDGDEALPPLRQTLQVVPCSASGVAGSATHMIVDPVRHQYVRLTERLLQIYSAWDAATIPQIMRALAQRNIPVSVADVKQAIKFAHDNQLTVAPAEGGWRAFAGLAQKGKKSPFMQAAHTYIFFRIPLFRPERLLTSVWPLIGWVFTRGFARTTAAIGVFSLFLVQRQWDVFMTSFSAFLTLEGFFAYAAALVVVKIIHEFGHAFMAHKYGVQVPVIGAAFIVLFPILYTDTTAAWTLSRRKRLMVDAAGIFTELSLAVYATLAWVLLPDGNLRDVAFVVATVSWVMSLVVNLNPLMRFDGYYLLADATGVENLQARGFALARWRVREWLFGFGDPVPERFSPFAHKAVIFHAFCVWLYRFFLFLGIALLVYHKTTKVLGIVLFVVEIMIFIGKPIAAEMAQWGKRRADMRWNRQSVRSVFLGAAAIGLMFIPISLPFHLPAVAGVGQVTAVHPQAPGRLVEVHVVEGQAVRRGDVLFALEAPSLLHDERQLLKREALLEHRIARTAADQQDRSNLMILQSQLAGIQSEMQSLSERGGQLSIAAQSDGIVRNVQGDLAPGQWVSPTTRLALLVAGGEPQVTGYVAAERLRRVQDQTSGTFVPDQPEFPKIAVSVSRFEVPAEGDARLATLLDVYGGRIVSKPPVDGEPIAPDKPHYRVSTVAVGADEERFEVYRAQEVRGVLRLWPDAESFAVALVRRVAGVLIRESGF